MFINVKLMQTKNITRNCSGLAEKKDKKTLLAVNYALLMILISSMGANQYFLNASNEKLGIKYEMKDFSKAIMGVGGGAGQYPAIAGGGKELTGDISKDSISLAISSGAPEVYGAELNVSFDQVQQSMNIMRQYDPYDFKPGGNRIIPEGNNLKRYTDIGNRISCEYCCGAKAIVGKDGKAACGCAHSMAMRGLAAYLITKHGSEYNDDEILRELARWKGMYFPKQMITKMATQLQSGSYTPDISALVLGLKLPDYGKGEGAAPLPSDIQNLPGMVGGC